MNDYWKSRQTPEDVAVGREVVITGRSNTPIFGKVSKVTATQLVVSGNYADGRAWSTRFMRDSGREVGASRYYAKSLFWDVEEVRREQAARQAKHPIVKILRDFGVANASPDWSVEQLHEAVEPLREAVCQLDALLGELK